MPETIDSTSRILVVAEMPSTRKMVDTMLHASGVQVVRTVPDRESAKELILSKAVDFVLFECAATSESREKNVGVSNALMSLPDP